eukprot:GSChrysophyteH1.ASY1.ANO1.3322.1 assembled CDS
MASFTESPEPAAQNPYPDFPAYSRVSPVVCLVIGMAGSGKTTLMHRINLSMNEMGKKAYYINLDPAVKTVPYAANIDIRDTVNYKEVMSQYGLGPNGSILTSLNLFATRFDQVIGLLDRRADNLDYIFLLGSSFPTTILYATDTPRCTSPTTFMICVFNKIDVTPCEPQMEWMRDFEAYQEALDGDRTEDYMGPLNRSLSLGMDEFYRSMQTCGVSALTGAGIAEMLQKIDDAGEEFKTTFLPEIVRRLKLKAVDEERKAAQSMEKLKADLEGARG